MHCLLIGINNTTMKKYICFSFLSFILFLLACEGGRKEYIRYEILNISNYEISIETYNTGETQRNGFISLNADGGLWQSENFISSGPSSSNFQQIDFVLNGDSIVTFFESKKLKIDKLTNLSAAIDDHNILSHSNYEIIKTGEDIEVLQFTFTNVDYENAEEIVD